MAYKIVIFSALLVAAANGGLLGAPLAQTYAAAPALAAPVLAKTVVAEEYDSNPQYTFGYDVQDGLTGDSKSQIESRSGDVVQGSYSLVDPDGTKRTVEYTADPINGFNAVVHKEPLVQKAVVAAPAIAKVAAPVAYSAPVLRSSPLLAAPAIAAAPVLRSAPLLQAAPVLRSGPILQTGALGLAASPLAYSTGLYH